MKRDASCPGLFSNQSELFREDEMRSGPGKYTTRVGTYADSDFSWCLNTVPARITSTTFLPEQMNLRVARARIP